MVKNCLIIGYKNTSKEYSARKRIYVFYNEKNKSYVICYLLNDKREDLIMKTPEKIAVFIFDFLKDSFNYCFGLNLYLNFTSQITTYLTQKDTSESIKKKIKDYLSILGYNQNNNFNKKDINDCFNEEEEIVEVRQEMEKRKKISDEFWDNSNDKDEWNRITQKWKKYPLV